MFGLETLDVIIGLVFVYLLLSLACTALNELLSQWLNARAETLREGVHGILSSGKQRDLDPAIAAAQETAAANALEAVKRSCREDAAAAGAYAAYESAVTAVNAAKDAVATQSAAERAARAKLQRAEANLTTALTAKAEPPAIAALQREIETARTALEGLIVGTRARADTANAAEQTRVDSFKALRKAAPAKADALDRAEKALDIARGDRITAALYDHPIIRALSQPRFALFKKYRLPSYIPARAFRAALLDIVAPGAPPTSATLANLRANTQKLPEQIARPLVLFIDSAGDDIDRFRTAVENWYEDSMERVSGLYKRRAQLTVLILAFVVTLFANADTLRITRALTNNQTLREAVVAQAEALANNPSADISALLALEDSARAKRAANARNAAAAAPPPAAAAAPATEPADTTSATESEALDTAATTLNADSIARFRLRQIRASIDSLQTLGLPLGWQGQCTPQELNEEQAKRARAIVKARNDSIGNAAARDNTPRLTGAPAQNEATPDTTALAAAIASMAGITCFRWSLPNEAWHSRIAGLLITILAISLGAPFWFDMLNKIVNIRSAGRAPEEKPKSPEVLPPATGAGK